MALTVQVMASAPARAATTCEFLFQPASGATALFSVLPPEFQQDFAALKPRVQKGYAKRYEKWDRVSADNEAMRLIGDLLIETDTSNPRVSALLSRETRIRSIQELLQHRQNQDEARAKLQKVLLEIGYGTGSMTSQKWHAFRAKHSLELALTEKFAKNIASIALLGIPLFLSSKQNRNFQVRESSPEKIERDLKIESAVEFASRVAAYAVLILILNEFLDLVTPKWGLFKAKARSAVSMETRDDLERSAYSTWKELNRAFTGETPADGSSEASEMMARIRASSKDTLWLHVHHGTELTEIDPIPQSSSHLDEVDRMYLGPNLGR